MVTHAHIGPVGRFRLEAIGRNFDAAVRFCARCDFRAMTWGVEVIRIFPMTRRGLFTTFGSPDVSIQQPGMLMFCRKSWVHVTQSQKRIVRR